MSTSLTIVDEEIGFGQPSIADFDFDPAAVFNSLLGLDHEPVATYPCWVQQPIMPVKMPDPGVMFNTPPFSDPSPSSSGSPESTPPNPPSSPDSVFLRPTDQDAKLRDDDSKFKRARKRRKVTTTPVVKDPSTIASVRLPREELVHMSRTDMKEFAQMKAAERPLTQAEQQELQRQMRAVRNRESAQLSRKRKREQIESLSDQVNRLTAENEQLRNENVHLKQELEQIRSPAPARISESYSISRRTQVGAGAAIFMTYQPMNGHVLDTAQTHPSPSRTILEAPFVNVVDASEDDETDLLKHEYNSVVPSSHEPDATDQHRTGSWRAKNMTYFVSEHLTRVDPPWAEPGDNHLLNDEHPFFAVIMPESAFTGPSSEDFTSYDFVEVICGLVAVNILPHGLAPPIANL